MSLDLGSEMIWKWFSDTPQIQPNGGTANTILPTGRIRREDIMLF